MQTAIGYFDEQIQERVIAQDVVARKMIIEISMEDYIEIKRQAKEMEKQQHKWSFIRGYDRCEWDNSVGSYYDEEPKEFEQYYNETYGSKGSDETKTDKL